MSVVVMLTKNIHEKKEETFIKLSTPGPQAAIISTGGFLPFSFMLEGGGLSTSRRSSHRANSLQPRVVRDH